MNNGEQAGGKRLWGGGGGEEVLNIAKSEVLSRGVYTTTQVAR